MNGSEYRKKDYKAEVSDGSGCDVLTVSKFGDNTDWSSVRMVVNGGVKDDEITLRSQDHAEQLHFLLGQMLGR